MERKFFLGQYLICVILLLGQLHGYKSCIQKEKLALLELKKYIISQSRLPDFVLPTWTNDRRSDCCRWEGLKCNRTSGRVTEIVLSDLFLKESSLFNLSLLHPFEEVRSLNFSTLVGGSCFFDDVEGYKSLGKLSSLKILDLSRNKFNNSIFPFLNAATSLTTLFLRENNLDGPFPAKELKDLTNLELLDLSSNRFNGSIPVQELSSLRKLKALDLSGNEFSASMGLQGICEMKNMLDLDLSRNKLVGQFPLCLTSLSGLRVLDLSSNQLTGNVPPALELGVFKLGSKSKSLQVESESSWKPKFHLSVIELPSCNLVKVPHFLVYQKDLRRIDLSHNNVSGNFPSWLLANNTQLKVLFLQNNSFTSFQLPKSAHKLLILDVSANEFSHLLPENIGWILPHLRYMNISKNGFQGNMPSSLGNMERIQYLDISHNNFQGKLPRSFVMGCYSMVSLTLSHNNLSGEIFPESVNFTDISELSMDNNQFTGKIGKGLRSLRYLELLDISNNNLTGVIPSWIGELKSLVVVLVSNNSLEGEIPVSLFNRRFLQLLDLSANNLSGGIPPHVNSRYPVALFLQDNKLSGVVPDTLLTNVTVLDLRNNRLSGNIPEFTNNRNTHTLLLPGNNLTGSIPHQLCGLRNIQLLDLSNNRLNGSIPSCLSNTSFLLGKEEDIIYDYDYGRINQLDLAGGFQDPFKFLIVLDPFSMVYGPIIQLKIEFATKHRYDAYVGGVLVLLFGMDLSENELSGDIPVELGGLLEIQALNLSHNNLSGVIPDSFSGLKNVESLDLSFNKLQGRIPPRLADLSSLGVFNVSYNNLSGAIPLGRHFSTFDTQSFLGNPLLCGQPTDISCNGNTIQAPDNVARDEESTIDMVSFYWSFAAAYVTVLLGVLASLSFDSPWSRFWFYTVDAFIHKARNLLW
ncbi:hypothetical protein EUTSA_v10018093mg [Eutrema salsugineum]|uniref:Leucine-rich repeat-containing N-terminal plant-type domain-containing protein n=1 Tax=Eutrema salsugineum TaxID=72664 RepID=V4KD76_EUTSA|nr:hypothetical protein EUTSA_v10018093mg [Eutrema salsugineum]